MLLSILGSRGPFGSMQGAGRKTESSPSQEVDSCLAGKLADLFGTVSRVVEFATIPEDGGSGLMVGLEPSLSRRCAEDGPLNKRSSSSSSQELIIEEKLNLGATEGSNGVDVGCELLLAAAGLVVAEISSILDDSQLLGT